MRSALAPIEPLARRDAASTELMRQFQESHDDSAFCELYQLNAPRIERLVQSCLRFGARDLCAEEIVQDVFVSVFRSAHRFRPERETAFRRWTAQIARNAVRRAIRERRARQTYQNAAIFDIIPEHARVPEESDAIEAGSAALPVLLCALAAGLEQLLPRDREILDEAEVLLLSYEEIARRHRLRRATVRMVIFRARRRLYARIESLLYGANASRAAAHG